MRLIPTTAALILAGTLLTAPAYANDQVCEPLSSGKVDTTGDPVTVTITAPPGHVITRVCIKAGSSKQGDGPVYVDVDPPEASIVRGHPSGKAVSHWSAEWELVTPEPEPEPEPEDPADPEVPEEEPETPAEDPEEPRDDPKPHAPIGLPRDREPLANPGHSVPPRTSSLTVECIGGALVKRITDADGNSETRILSGHRACPQVDADGDWFKEAGL